MYNDKHLHSWLIGQTKHSQKTMFKSFFYKLECNDKKLFELNLIKFEYKIHFIKKFHALKKNK